MRPFKGNGNAKIVTGVRRCGKSSLLETFIDSFPDDVNIIRINMQHPENEEIKQWRKLYDHVLANLDASKNNILFVDEIQEVEEWESAIRGLISKQSCEIYLTGSNSKLLSTEFSTYLTGRYDRFHVLPLSFSECVEFHERYHGAADPNDVLKKFIRTGGFPLIWRYNMDVESADGVVKTLVDSSITNDIVKRYNIRNVDLLKRILKVLASTIGSYASATNIYNALISGGNKVSMDVIYDYLEYLERAYLIIKAETMDIKGREILRSSYKYYVTDLGIKHALLGYRPDDISGHMENIIFTELIGRGYDVYVGKADGKEVDFVAERGTERLYVQVCKELGREKTIKREFGNLEAIRDSYPKFVVLMEAGMFKGIFPKGIICCGLREFLEMPAYGLLKG